MSKRTNIKNGKQAVAGFSLAQRKEVKPTFKYQIIYCHWNEYSISIMCQIFGVSRSGYYDFIKRPGKPEKNAVLEEKQCTQQVHCFQTYGYMGMHLWLESQEIHYNLKTILKIMKKYSILSEI